MTQFGKRNAGSSTRVASRPTARTFSDPNPVTDYVAPTIHNTHFEKHWPKYGATVAAGFCVVTYLIEGKFDPVVLVTMAVVPWFLAYLGLNRVRNSIDAVHTARTQLFRSTPFLLGAGLGLGFFLFSSFIQQVTILGFPVGGSNPFADGFQQIDFASIAMLTLGAAGFMVGGGVILEFVTKPFRGEEKSDTGSNAR